MTYLLAALLLWQAKIMPPTDLSSNVDILLRWIHLVAGITWIGLLYFFNLVNVPAMKAFDAPTKGKYVPTVLPLALWYFRWGAVLTVLAGFLFWVLTLHREPQPPLAAPPGAFMLRTIGIWFAVVVVAWAIQYGLLRVPAVTKNGWWVAMLVTLLAAAILYVNIRWNTYEGMSHSAISIAVGGGYGFFMLLNVWGIIWPAQKRIIAWTKENADKGTAIPPQSATLARRAFLASRANAWLSLPMLFFMAAARHYAILLVD